MLLTASKRIAPPRRLLYGPGPSMVEPRAYEAMKEPVVGIRDAYFLEILGEIRAGLREVFGTRNQMTFPVPASGSGAMEAAVANFVRPGSKFALFAAGHFANRIGAMAQRQGATVVNSHAWQILGARMEDLHTWYLDLRLMSNYFEPPHVYQHTPSPPLYYAMHQGLAIIEEEGLENRWNRHKRVGERLVSGLVDLGFEPLVRRPEDRIWHLTTVIPPKGVDEAQLRQKLIDNYDVEIASGLGQLAGKILRIGTMGPLATQDNVESLLGAIK